MRQLLKFSIIALTTSIVAPVTQFLVRSNIISAISYEVAGYWEALWRLSQTHVMFFTTVLAVYYLPKFSMLKVASDLKDELITGLKFILVTIIFSSFLIFSLKDSIIILLFAPQFMVISDQIWIILLGDTVRMLGWLLGYLMVSQVMTKSIIFFEIMGLTMFYFSSKILISFYGLSGASIAYFLTYALNLFVVILYVPKKLELGLFTNAR